MSWAEYYAVRHSDLYENKGVAKSLLSLIALLIIGPPDDDEEPDPQEGFCVASQRYLACEIGCEDSVAGKHIRTFVSDGWLNAHAYRDSRGYQRRKYSIPPDVLERIKERERKRDETGEYIRKRNPNMRRADNGKRFSPKKPTGNIPPGIDDENFDDDNSFGQSACEPQGNLPVSHQVICPQASGQFARSSLSFRESYQQDLEKVQSPKDEYERGIESETKEEAHTPVCISETDKSQTMKSKDNQFPIRDSGTSSPNPDKVKHPRDHVFNGTDFNCQFPNCMYVCPHRSSELKRKGSSFVEVCRECGYIPVWDELASGSRVAN